MPRIPRVYVDNSVIGGCCDDEFKKWSTILIEDFRIGLLHPVVSVITNAEMADAPEEVLEVYAELLDIGPEVLELSTEAENLAETYIKRGILTEKFRNDALHIALATVASVDILVSWNFRHVVHFDKIRQFNAVNIELGYKSIEIHSPREVISHEPQSDEDGS